MPFVAVDFETTGLSAKKHRVVEIGAVVFDAKGTIFETFNSLVDPGTQIGATSIHGISEIDLVDAPSFAQVLPAFADFLIGNTLVAHNAPFDIGFLERELERSGVRFSSLDALCTLELVSRVKPDAPRKLVKCCDYLGIPIRTGHHALDDALMTADLASRLNLAKYSARAEPVTFTVPRGLRREAREPRPREADLEHAIRGGSFLQELILQLPDSSAIGEIAESQYLDALENALLDGEITRNEAEDLAEVAKICHLSTARVQELHHEYFDRLCKVARANNYTSARERSRLKRLALLLGIDNWEVVLDGLSSIVVWQPGDPIRTGAKFDSDESRSFEMAEQATDFSDPQASSRLKGLRIVLTGVFSSFSREQGREAVTRRGGMSPEALSAKTNVLVAGEGSGPRKLEKASSMGIRILSEKQFLELLESGHLPEL